MDEAAEKKLTNDDFRKLFMTPRVSSGSHGAGTLSSSLSTPKETPKLSSSKDVETEDKAERRRKKKSFYAKLKKQEEDKMAELALKYRDRARERRDGANPDYQNDDPLSAAGAYRAVAPDLKSGFDAAERRRQMIQESKFLGGDMEHTHLVKGLDYALLQKVRSEITTKEMEEEEELEKYIKPHQQTKKEKQKENPEEGIQFKTILGRNVHRIIMRKDALERNDFFASGRMAYIVELEDEFAESDIPTILIRSKADVPSSENHTTLTTNDIVINKLAQILSYLRQGNRNTKKGKKGKKNKLDKNDPPEKSSKTEEKERQTKVVEDSIYGDIGEYVPAPKKVTEHKHSLVSAVLNKSQELTKSQKLLSKLTSEPEGYAECYPGFQEMNDAIEDSDDEADYTKMDMGNKKGPIGRWDFDSQEEYSDYMNNKEALPKAAFQYGVKMADGRRTRKFPKERNERAELDREWQKIQAIIHKRKGGAGGESSEAKKSRN